MHQTNAGDNQDKKSRQGPPSPQTSQMPIWPAAADLKGVKYRESRRESNASSWISDDGVSTIAPEADGPLRRRLVWPDESYFEGEVDSNGLPNGQGILRMANGNYYEGEWAAGEMNGSACYCIGDTQYEGTVLNNERNGTGQLVLKSGVKYEGDWRKDKPNGWGRFENKLAGVTYEGEWVDGKAEGHGTLVVESWGTYTGGWKRHMRFGIGRVTYSNGCTYDGEWEEGVAHGQGVYTWETGEYYEGEFVKGQMSGRGTLVSKDGTKFNGEWKENERCGFGHIAFSDGALYSGEWRNDRPEGWGRFVNTEKVLFEGEWKNGKFIGQDRRGLKTCVIESDNYVVYEDLKVVHPNVVPGNDLLGLPNNIPAPKLVLRIGEAQEDGSYIYDTEVYKSKIYPLESNAPLDYGYMYHTQFRTITWPLWTGEERQTQTQTQVLRSEEDTEPQPRVETAEEVVIEVDEPPVRRPFLPPRREIEYHARPCYPREETVPQCPADETYYHLPPQRVNVPRPLEHATEVHFVLPKIKERRREIKYPVYAPRIVEVPVPVETLSDEGLRICDEIAMEVERLRGSKPPSGRDIENVMTAISSHLDRANYVRGSHTNPVQPRTLSQYLPPDWSKMQASPAPKKP